MPLKIIKDFIKLESTAGIFLFAATVIALIWANSPISGMYHDIINMPLSIYIGEFGLDKPLIFWINEGFMTIFFLLVGLEIKRELLDGELNSIKKIATPAIAAFGGMAIPALIYLAFNHNNPELLKGWATPVATDIAFALGILALLGSRVPSSLKIFLISLAIFDDIGAILIIAVFYTSELNYLFMFISVAIILFIIFVNKFKFRKRYIAICLDITLWYCIYKSGIHPSIAGIIIAMLIPYHHYNKDESKSSLKILEEKLHPWVVYMILPIFAFANAGISFAEITYADLTSSLTLGIFAALFFGNQIGVFGVTMLAVKLKLAQLPHNVSLKEFYGVCMICGVGFTMSLFVGSLAFNDLHEGFKLLNQVKLGVILGSATSGLLGYLFLRWATKNRV